MYRSYFVTRPSTAHKHLGSVVATEIRNSLRTKTHSFDAARTDATRRVAAAPANAFRKLTKSELIKIGASPKSERYIEIGKRITKTATTISHRAHDLKRFRTALAAYYIGGDVS